MPRRPNLLLADPATGKPIQLNFKTQTFDVEVGHAALVGGRHAFSYGGNYRRNNFDITLAPDSKNRNEIGAYVQDEIVVGMLRFSLGGRVDKFGNIEDPVFSPRLAAILQPVANQSLRLSFNRAFRSPSDDQQLSRSAARDSRRLERAGAAAAAGRCSRWSPIRFRWWCSAVGSELPIGSTPQAKLKQESLTAYEVAYTRNVRRPGRRWESAFYVNDFDDNINFVQLPSNARSVHRGESAARMAAAAVAARRRWPRAEFICRARRSRT